jgi:DNA primase
LALKHIVRYEQNFLDNLKQQTDIVRLVQDYVPLKKKGNNYWACCPFHGEKTASFSVNPKGFFYCFGCGKKGSAFNFVMEIENIGFSEAVKLIADKQGVNLPVPQPVSRADEERIKAETKAAEIKKSAAETIIKLNSFALEFWENCLQENNAEARAAREYIEQRSISPETRQTFRLGYAPDSWDALLTYLKQTGADEKTIETSGLISKNEEKNRAYDRFRGRVIFPVLDAAGKPVAFGARTLGAGEPKYLNSPETAAYTKGNHLYGLFQNAAEIRRRKFAILVEGYLDLITPFQHGVGNCVASLGTALTNNQARLLSRYAKRVKINYDGDKAGIKAAQRAIEILLAEDFEIKVLVLPNGADPDEFIKQNGVAEYNSQHAKRSITFAPFVLEQAVADRDFRNAVDKQAAFDEILPFLRVTRNSIERREFFDAAINRLNIDETHRSELLKSLQLSAAANQSKPNLNELKQQIAVAVKAKPTIAEQDLLELLLHDADLRAAVLPTLEPSDYEHLASAEIFRALIKAHAGGNDITVEKLQEIMGESDLLGALLLSEPARAEDEALDDYLSKAENCVVSLRQMAIDRRLRDIRDELVRAEQNGENERFSNLLTEQRDLGRLRNELGNLV